MVLGRTTKVRRLLPNKNRRMVGAWCFVDHYGPDDLSGRVDSYGGPGGMLVPPHPHTSLQTVSWLFEGEIEHRDSVGSHAMVRPGELNIMTAGNGIAHSEVSLPDGPPTMHGAQLWVALPDSRRTTVAPHFNAYADLPTVELDGAEFRHDRHGGRCDLAGPGLHAPGWRGRAVGQGRSVTLPPTPTFEYAVLVVAGSLTIGDLRPGFGRDGLPRRRAGSHRVHRARGGALPAPRWRTVRGRAGDVVELHRPQP